jgi:hypothetical protein
MPSLDSYYKPDFSHRKNTPQTSSRSSAPQYEIGLDGVPVRRTGGNGLPSDYKRTELLASGQIYGGLPSDYKETELAAGQKAEDFRKGAGFTGQTPTVPTRDVQKANGAKGTQTSPGGGMPTLTAEGIAGILQNRRIGRGAFSSVQLPGTTANPITGSVPDAFNITGLESITSGTLGAFSNNGLNFAALDNSGITPEQAFTNPELTKTLGSTLAQYGGLASGAGAFAQQAPGAQKPTASPIKSGRLADALNDTESMRGPETQEGLMRRANAAFLNAKTAQEGLRAKEAVLGQFHTAGQTYQLGTDNKLIQGQTGKPLAMDRDAASSYRLGTSSAQQYKDSYKDKVKEIPAAIITDPKQAENPTAQNPVPVSREQNTVDPNIIENYDFTKPGAEDAYFGPGGILEKATKRR